MSWTLSTAVIACIAIQANPDSHRSRSAAHLIHAAVKEGVLQGDSLESITERLEQKGLLGQSIDGGRHRQLLRATFAKLTKDPEVVRRRSKFASRGDRSPSSGSRGSGSSESEPNDSQATADALTLGDAVTGKIATKPDVDFWTFTLAEREVVTLAAVATGALDSQLTLFDANGTELDFDDDDGASFDARIVTVLPVGQYFVRVSGFSSSGDYRLESWRATTVHKSRGRDVVDAEVAAAGEVVAFDFSTPYDADAELSASALGSGLDTVVRLVDPTGRVLFEDDDGGTVPDARLSATISAGSYVAIVDTFAGGGHGSFLYRSAVAPLASSTAYELEPNDSLPQATPVSVFDVVGGVISAASDVDLFAFEVTRESHATLKVDATDHSFDPVVEVYDSAGVLIEVDDDSGTGLNPRLDLRLGAGIYYLKVASSSGTGGYRATIVATSALRSDAVESEPNDTLAAADPIRPGGGASGAIGGASDVDRFKLEIETAIPVTVSAVSITAGLDLQVSILDAAGTELYFDDDSGRGADSCIQNVLLRTGTYYVHVASFGGTVGSYDVLVNAPLVAPVEVVAGGDFEYSIVGQNQDWYLLLLGTLPGVIEGKLGNQLVVDATFYGVLGVPPCGAMELAITVPVDLVGLTFLVQELMGLQEYGGYYSNVVSVTVR